MRTTDPGKLRRIMEAAVHLFAERHYHRVRMEDIAAGAGVAKGTLYLHFKDKESLYLGLLLQGTRQLYEDVQKRIAGVKKPEDKLLVFVREAIRFFERYPYFLELIQRVEVSLPEAQTAPLRDYRRRFLELLAGVLGEVNRSRRFARVDAELGALALIGMVREILRSRPQPWSTRLAGWIVRHFLHGIGKPG